MAGTVMNAQWFVAKYMSDMRRREPVNVGVILLAEGRFYLRFVGEKQEGDIDGRRARRFVDSLDNYKAWCEYWRYLFSRDWATWDSIGAQSKSKNYYLEPSGQTLFNFSERSPEEFLDELFSMLVEEAPRPRPISVKRQSERIIRQLGIWDRIDQDYPIDVPRKNAIDRIVFDYAFRNGKLNLMKAVSLMADEDYSWASVHAAVHEFDSAASALKGTPQLISLVGHRDLDNSVTQQLGVLRSASEVVLVHDHEAASENLRTRLGI